MKLEEALQRVHHCTIPELGDYSTLNKITHPDFYFPSPVKLRSKNDKCRFILFSAPGAVGKTALAKNIAFQYGGLYWNIGTKPVGNTAFAGEVTHAVGIGNGAKQDEFYAKLRSGDALVVLDAFDEASLISKKEGVREFLIEIGSIVSDTENPSIILTARTEMAAYICEICRQEKYGIDCYDLDYFEETDAPEFITQYLISRGLTPKQEQRSQISDYIDEIKNRLPPTQTRQFIGYAQVLCILARQFEQVFKLKATDKLCLTQDKGSARSLIYDIIQNLLDREQQKLAAFKEQIRSKYCGNESVVDDLYNRREQIVRLFYYTLAEENIAIDDVPECSELLPDDQAAYLRLLQEWLPQHVFLEERKLMPIFSDYMLAEALLNPDLDMFAEDYQLYGGTRVKLPTRVFMDCYLTMNDNCVKSNHIYFLDMAFSSQATPKGEVFCTIGKKESNEDITDPNLYMTFLTKDSNKEEFLPIQIQRNGDEPICLNRAENISVSVDGTVKLVSRFSMDVIIRQASIECDQLDLDAPEISFETYGNERNILIIHDEITRIPTCKIFITGTKKLGVEPPKNNSLFKRNFYEFNDYLYSFESSDTTTTVDEIDQFVYGLKKVLEQFKTDKYNSDPAKHKDKIDSRCHVGVKARVLQFLKDVQLIYEDGIMYKCRLTRMDELEISRTAYLKGQCDHFTRLYSKYQHWYMENFS